MEGLPSDTDIVVLGGGISGLSTAVALISQGYRVTIVADFLPGLASSKEENPVVPTSYAMASAYPHNLKIEGLEKISDHSQSVFKELERTNSSGVHKYKMFEVFELEPTPPPLRERRMDFVSFEGSPEELKSTINPPIRPGAQYLFGYFFYTYFCDMPIYLDYLWQIFTTSGGNLINKDVTTDYINTIPEDIPLINCLGLGALGIFEDKSDCIIMRGSQLLIEGAPMIEDEEGTPIAYNYTPEPSVYPRQDGKSEYVHFFPRQDGWLLGQTREPGKLDQAGNWTGEAVNCQYFDIKGKMIPKPIITLNHEILEYWKNITINTKAIRARTGYRYYRDPQKSGVRLELERIGNRAIIHNYGHGGSGVTMSWGCARHVLELLTKNNLLESKQAPASSILQSTLTDLFSKVS